MWKIGLLYLENCYDEERLGNLSSVPASEALYRRFITALLRRMVATLPKASGSEPSPLCVLEAFHGWAINIHPSSLSMEAQTEGSLSP
jgi:hypothetical protein